MKRKALWTEFWQAFFVSTVCIDLLMAVLGSLFLPDAHIGYEAFLSPPLFGLLSSLFGLLLRTGEEMSPGQVLLRKGIHLLLIEALVFGLNAWSGHFFEPPLFWTLLVSIMLVYAAVCGILWGMDQRTAREFNRKLKEYQRKG